MNKRLSISRDDVQNRSKMVHTRWKRVAIGFSIFVGLVLIGNVIAVVSHQISVRKSDSIVANNKNEAERVLNEWNQTLTDCAISAKADTTISFDNEPYVSVLIRYPKDLLANWSGSKGFQELDCFTKNIYGVELSQKVDFQNDIPQNDNSIFLNENLIIHEPDGGRSRGLWGAISDNSFSSSFSSNEIIVQFFRDGPFE